MTELHSPGTSPGAGTTEAELQERASAQGLAQSNAARALGLTVAVAALAAVCVLSIAIGAKYISVGTVWNAMFFYQDVHDHVAIWELRIPRTVVGLIVGPALGVCGALIQAFTRNPLADPGILGVNAGATFAVTLGVGFFGVTAAWGYIWFALVGAGVVTVLVYLLGATGRGRVDPVKLVLAGVAISAVLGGMTTAIILGNRDAFNDMRFWGVGSIAGRDIATVLSLSPLILAGLLVGAFAARSLNALALGDDLATAMGVRIGRIRVAVIAAVTVLAGTATALAGPIGFVGLMVPHIVRWFVGPDQRWILAFTVVVAPTFLLTADIVGRVIMPTGELRVGLVTAVVGAPVLIALARRKSVSGL